MKNIFDRKTIISFMCGMLLCSGIVYGIDTYESNEVEYSPTDASWEVSNVSTAINSLHTTLKDLENIKTLGNATSSQILSGRTALVQGKLVTGTMPDNGAWTNTPTGSGKVTIPAGYHNGSGYVNTANAYTNGYNAGVAAADARANSNSANYQAGYNAGVAAADARANSSSANYQAGYNAGVAAALDKTGTATATLSKDYLDEGSTSKYVITVAVGSYKNSKTLYWGANSDRSDSVAVNFKLQ